MEKEKMIARLIAANSKMKPYIINAVIAKKTNRKYKFLYIVSIYNAIFKAKTGHSFSAKFNKIAYFLEKFCIGFDKYAESKNMYIYYAGIKYGKVYEKAKFLFWKNRPLYADEL